MEKKIGDRISAFVDKKNTSIIIYPKRTRWKEALLLAWVACFTLIGFFMIYLLFGGLESYVDNSLLEGDVSENLRNQKIYILVFVGFWLYFEFKVVKGLLWVILGKELVQITTDSINIKNSILSYGKSNRYFFENVKNFDMIEHKELSFGFDYENAFWRRGTDSLIFDHRGKSIAFGKKLSQKDARLLFRFIVDRRKKQTNT